MDLCLECGKEFVRLKPNQRFCSGGRCRSIYHNKEKVKGLPLTPEIREEIRSLAEAHEITENEMAVRMYYKWTNPQHESVKVADLYGQKEGDT